MIIANAPNTCKKKFRLVLWLRSVRATEYTKEREFSKASIGLYKPEEILQFGGKTS
jgi:hypothetical protein